MKRRAFLKGAALAAGVVALGSNLNAKTDDKSKENKMNTQVWYITAASGGLGLALAKYLLSKGDKVAGTSRNLKNIIDKLGKESENFLPLELKFGEKMSENIEANIAAIKSKFGRLDNVVNNAGYGLLGFVEETSEEDLRAQFEVNVFAPFLVAKHALKLMRPQAISEGGNAQNVTARIFNLSSIGGFRVTNNSTPYCMSKFALSAFSEGLLLDLKDFGIHSVNIMPAGFRTQFLGTSMELSRDKIGDYDAKREAFEAHAKNYSGKQAGNPAKFAEILYNVSRMQEPPFSLFLGAAAFSSARNKIAWLEEDMKNTEHYAGSAADFENSAGSAFSTR
ncbi:SDR family oxidoreductase [Campylobacter hyointestinalis]|uniref:SDR family oxidoreductase n=1 Tax=Campylobacter hyointestinalis TaxID=198 RepID=UPI00255730E8|nr:SDR family oxidoreductase [Campylobacter hyointestinalis]MDL2346163.1 SDR family oxidoreductase [Campylobacter hyointestinalis]MDL2347903.1 SDR family oxidoreductase [Campylobacter hyointestinalis]MDL2349646.1 SDR family oxidoreductase [Campylobacter hyointestinalis]MDM1025679.1 SDR family oxidoreductase [Campylobacter hyointestinalis]MDM1027652.1 SDR family oxidoreductase [Campylobacter hyointestinalis]